MAIEQILPFLGIVPDLLRQLPLLVFILQTVGYLFLAMFFGSIAIKGYRGYANVFLKYGIRLGLGFIALIGGISFSNLLPFFTDSFFKTFQIDLIIYGFISSFIVLLTVYMITFNIFNIEGIRRQIENLQRKLEKTKDIRGKKLAPISVVGIIILVVFIAFSLFFFRGFPNVLDELGLNAEELESMAQQIENLNIANLPAGCISLITLTQEFGPEGLVSAPHTDAAAQALIEAQSGSTVKQTYLVTYNGKDVIIGVTENGQICTVTNNQFCECFGS